MKKRFALMAATLMALQIFAGVGGYSPSLAEEPEKSIWPDQPVVEEHSIWPDQPEDPEAEAPAEEAMPEQEREDNMATKGMAVFRSNGEDYTVNDPNIANEFSALTSYAAGTYVNYQGNLYKFTTDHAAGSWNSAHVSQVLLGQDVSDLKSAVNNCVATAIPQKAAGDRHGSSVIDIQQDNKGNYEFEFTRPSGSTENECGLVITLGTYGELKNGKVYVYAEELNGKLTKVQFALKSGSRDLNGLKAVTQVNFSANERLLYEINVDEYYSTTSDSDAIHFVIAVRGWLCADGIQRKLGLRVVTDPQMAIAAKTSFELYGFDKNDYLTVSAFENALYSENHETIVVSETGKTAANINYGIYAKNNIYVYSFDPSFDIAENPYDWKIYRYEDNTATNTHGTLIKEGSGLSGTPTIIDHEFVAGKDILKIISLDTYGYNNQSPPFNDFFGVVQYGQTDQFSAVIPHYVFSGTYSVITLSENYAKKTEINNYLIGKKVMACGDSMTAGHSLGVNGSWLKIIADRNEMTSDNRATNGAYLSDRDYDGVENSIYSKICDSESALYISNEDMASYDWIIIFGGTNDANHLVTLGDINSTNPSEFYGALNLICSSLHDRAPKAKVGFITPYLRNSNYQAYIDAIHDVCEKNAIPVFDNSTHGGIKWGNVSQMTALTLGDSFHLNADGMTFASYRYEAFMRTM